MMANLNGHEVGNGGYSQEDACTSPRLCSTLHPFVYKLR
jgi:hypothetical protein